MENDSPWREEHRYVSPSASTNHPHLRLTLHPTADTSTPTLTIALLRQVKKRRRDWHPSAPPSSTHLWKRAGSAAPTCTARRHVAVWVRREPLVCWRRCFPPWGPARRQLPTLRNRAAAPGPSRARSWPPASGPCNRTVTAKLSRVQCVISGGFTRSPTATVRWKSNYDGVTRTERGTEGDLVMCGLCLLMCGHLGKTCAWAVIYFTGKPRCSPSFEQLSVFFSSGNWQLCDWDVVIYLTMSRCSPSFVSLFFISKLQGHFVHC